MSKIQSVLGIVFFIFLAWGLSDKKREFPYKIIIKSLILQFFIAFLILKTKFGFWFFNNVNVFFTQLFSYSEAGAKFVFGKLVNDTSIGAIFAFKVLPIIIFISALMEALYYMGIISFIIKLLAKIFYYVLDITGLEAFMGATLIFMGIESISGIRAYLKKISKGEMFVIIVIFLSTIAGSVMATYASFGVPAGHLLCASLMSTPAAILFGRIIIPFEPKHNEIKIEDIEYDVKYSNIIEAYSTGATYGLKLALNIGAMVMVFVSAIYMIDGLVQSIGNIFNVSLTLDKIFSYLFAPLAWLMGVPRDESLTVGVLLGTKTVFNEFIAYLKLKPYLQGGPLYGQLSERSILISTYALCGFSNFGSLGIMFGAISALAPHFKDFVARYAIKALIAGSFACFTTAALVNIFLG